MKSYKRLLSAGLALIGMIFLFFPVTETNGGCNLMELLALWRTDHISMAVWLSGAVAAEAIAILIVCMGTGRCSLICTLIIMAGSFGSVLAAPWVYEKEILLPGWGCLGTLISWGLSMAVVFVAVIMDRAEKTDSGQGQEISEPMPAIAKQQDTDEEESGGEELVNTGTRRTEIAESIGKVNVYCGNCSGSVITLKHMESLVLGRSAADCNLVIDDISVSRKHCVITYNAVNNTYLLLDTSSNGTYLEGGQRIPKNFAMEVHSGLNFYIGKPGNKFTLG